MSLTRTTRARKLTLITVTRYRWNGRTMVPDAPTYTFGPDAMSVLERWADTHYSCSAHTLGMSSGVTVDDDGTRRFKLTVSGPDFPRFDWVTFSHVVEVHHEHVSQG